MRLTQHTDYALRVLIALGLAGPDKLTVSQMSSAYGISRHHLIKVVMNLAALGYVETLRGKGGGVRLAKPPEEIRLGQVIRQMEPGLGLVECLRSKKPGICAIEPACKLRGVLRRATEEFLTGLDENTLAGLLAPRAELGRLLRIVA